MIPRHKILTGVGWFVGVALLVGVVIYALPKAPPPVRATSPDGTWTVVVFAAHQETTGFGEGTFQMIVNIEDTQGRVVASLALGLAANRAPAERDYAVTFANNEVAHIGRVRTLKKSEFFP